MREMHAEDRKGWGAVGKGTQANEHAAVILLPMHSSVCQSMVQHCDVPACIAVQKPNGARMVTSYMVLCLGCHLSLPEQHRLGMCTRWTDIGLLQAMSYQK